MNQELKNAGFNPGELTDIQKEIIMQPSYAPENYHHDGEVTSKEARKLWEQAMKNARLSPKQIALAMYMHQL